ncbi:MAG: hypothetical protein A2X25_11220 [Chloroflexi bacterium GWB2_49_20]|nr:MAG: hypothetical protein A2X25_11220 [Chloroflexi bacterium GWB2_49_20]OGN78879.1 MAG: hypothetical protein A2X26_00130 [Chloroflexi bacterium GWC2_49_37]
MNELKWDLLAEVFGRMEAEIIQSMLNANGIDAELFQEAVGRNFAYPTTVGGFARVQIFVPKNKLIEAKELLKNSQNDTLEFPAH